jgi:Na+-transporting NADH:ubiquinone oxidoreductase subunit NqrC
MKMLHALCCSLLLVAAAFVQRPIQEAQALIGKWWSLPI